MVQILTDHRFYSGWKRNSPVRRTGICVRSTVNGESRKRGIKMLKIKEYVKAESLEQAYELNQKRGNRLIGGMLWMKMSNVQIQTAIDLSGLGLDKVEENGEEFKIGCMVTLRQLELHAPLGKFSHGMIKECVRHIAGVQFRNLATIGGSIFGRFGFSDVLTAFLALDSYVELYRGGVMPLREFAELKRDRDILVRIIVKKTPGRQVYLSHRNAKTDFPVLAVAVSSDSRGARVVVGARPAKALCVEIPQKWKEMLDASRCQYTDIQTLARTLAEQIPVGSNMRAGARYRSHLAGVLIQRGLSKLQKEEERQDAD